MKITVCDERVGSWTIDRQMGPMSLFSINFTTILTDFMELDWCGKSWSRVLLPECRKTLKVASVLPLVGTGG